MHIKIEIGYWFPIFRLHVCTFDISLRHGHSAIQVSWMVGETRHRNTSVSEKQVDKNYQNFKGSYPYSQKFT